MIQDNVSDIYNFQEIFDEYVSYSEKNFIKLKLKKYQQRISGLIK